MNSSWGTIWLIIKREFVTRVRKKTFLITTLLAPIGFAAIVIVPALVNKYTNDKQIIAIVDESGLLPNALADNEKLYFKLTNEPIDSVKKNYKSKGYDGVLHIPKISADTPNGITFYSDKELGIKTQYSIEDKLNNAIEKVRIKQAGLSDEAVQKLKPSITLSATILGEKEQKGNSVAASILGYFCAFSLYIILIGYCTAVMRGVAEEKTNRIIEVLISTVKPMHLMLGKIIGIGLVGLLQFALWMVLMMLVNLGTSFILGSDSSNQNAEISAMMQDENTMTQIETILHDIAALNWLLIIPTFLFYFLGGYFLYAAMFAAVGSAVNEETDGQSFSFPIMMPIILSIVLMSSVVEQPHGSVAVWGSLIPFTSPIIMMSRIGFGVPAWQLILSMLLLIAGFVTTTWLSAKIYRTGVLMQGKKITFKEMLRWIKH